MNSRTWATVSSAGSRPAGVVVDSDFGCLRGPPAGTALARPTSPFMAVAAAAG